MASGGSQAQSAWMASYKDARAHHALDSAFHKLEGHIQSHTALLQKHAQIRVAKWLAKLSEETANVVWKRNRNAWARLLLAQLRCGRLEDPFHLLPPETALPPVPKHAVFTAPACSASTSRTPDRASPSQQPGRPALLDTAESSAPSAPGPAPQAAPVHTIVTLSSDATASPSQELQAYLDTQGVHVPESDHSLRSTCPGTRMGTQDAAALLTSPPAQGPSPDAGGEEHGMTLALVLAREEVRSLEWRLAQTGAALAASRRQGAHEAPPAAERPVAGQGAGPAGARSPCSAGQQHSRGGAGAAAARPTDPAGEGLQAFAARTAALRRELDGRGRVPSSLSSRTLHASPAQQHPFGGGRLAGVQSDAVPQPSRSSRPKLSSRDCAGGGSHRQASRSRGEAPLQGRSRSPPPAPAVRHTLKSLAGAAAARSGPQGRAAQGAWKPHPLASPAAMQAHVLSPATPTDGGVARSPSPASRQEVEWDSPEVASTASLQRRLARSISDMLLVGVGSPEVGAKPLRLGQRLYG
ncbi:hypothetical protein ACKKBG_A22095 [Auxenochlorella protothecoides x Auxenochlorella symbiontica]